MENQFSRTELLLGKAGVEKLKNAKVAIFGVGGVGSYTVEALARAGIGEFYLYDDDKVSLSNINRQLIATHDTVGKYKVEVMKDRILSINPEAKVHYKSMFYTKENADMVNLEDFDYIVDAIDTVSAKIELVQRANEKGVNIISSMGAGNKLDPTKFEVSDIYKTSVCPLARVMRNELKKRKIKKLKVVYSKEVARKPIIEDESMYAQMCKSTSMEERGATQKRQVPASISFVPSVVGLIIAGEVIKDISQIR